MRHAGCTRNRSTKTQPHPMEVTHEQGIGIDETHERKERGERYSTDEARGEAPPPDLDVHHEHAERDSPRGRGYADWLGRRRKYPLSSPHCSPGADGDRR